MKVYVVEGIGEDWNGIIRTSVNEVFDSEEKAKKYCEQQQTYLDFITKSSIKTPFKEIIWHIEERILK